MNTVREVGRGRVPTAFGRKAAGLSWLLRHGYAVPRAFVIPWDAALDEDLRSELHRGLGARTAYAVRSSANLEDSVEHSFAGQFESYLGVEGPDAVFEAARAVRATAQDASLEPYLQRAGHSVEAVRMAVIVQEMVDPVVSGVAFSVDPLTGRERVVIECVEGPGSALMAGGVTPQRWVKAWGSWRERPDDAVVDLTVVAEVARSVEAMARRRGRPVDAEWVWDGDRVWWVQVRDVSTPPVTVWSNRLAREMLPGQIRPLVWSVNIPLVCGEWIRLLDELAGPTGLTPEELARSYHSYAYFNASALGDLFARLGFSREVIEVLSGIEGDGSGPPPFRPHLKAVLLAPRLGAFSWQMMRWPKLAPRELSAILGELAKLPSHAEIGSLSVEEARGVLGAVLPIVRRATRANIVTPLLASMYARMLRSRLDGHGVRYEDVRFLAEGEDPSDAGPGLSRLAAVLSTLPPETASLAAEGDLAGLAGQPGARPLLEELDRFLDEYGHLGDSGTDMSVATWRESPATVLVMASNHCTATGGDKLDRAALASRVSRRELARFDRVRMLLQLRAQSGALFTRVYGLYRPLYLRLGAELVERGAIAETADVFMLEACEVDAALDGELSAAAVRETVARRYAEMEAAGEAIVPEVVLGDEAPVLRTEGATTLHGVPTSRGQHVGRVVKGRSASDAARVEAGDVLVVPFSDASWTSLFGRAGAVVAESGGFLSHSSIIAREFGIPAVVSVDGAMALPEGALVAVDGFLGRVTIVEGAPERG